MNDSMGVQRVVPVVEPPTADNIIADQFMQAKVEPTPLQTISEQTTDEEQPPDPELKITNRPSDTPNATDLEKVRSALQEEITRGQVTVAETDGKITVLMTPNQKDGENQGDVGLDSGQRLDEDTVAIFAKVAQAQAEVVSEVQVLRSASTQTQSFDSTSQAEDSAGEELAQSEYEQIRSRLTTEIANGQINVERINDEVKISLADQGAFVSGSADLRSSFFAVLTSVGQALAQSPGEVTVAGHTDNVPVAFSERFQSNWDLSAARSASVADYLVNEGFIQPSAVTVTGYADTVPIASNDTAAGRAQNRRIEITVKGRAG
jgi:chemotaxis protein MotB